VIWTEALAGCGGADVSGELWQAQRDAVAIASKRMSRRTERCSSSYFLGWRAACDLVCGLNCRERHWSLGHGRKRIERGNAAENPHPLKAEGVAPRSRLGERWLEVEFEVCGAGDGVEAVRWGGLEAEGFVEGLGGLHGGESVEEHSFVTEGFRFCDQDDGELAADA